MTFTVKEFRDLIHILEVHPEWQQELRRLVLTEELLALPGLVRELVEAQRRTEERLLRLETVVQGLAEAQQRTDERLRELAEAQQRTEERLLRLETVVQGLIEAQQRTEERLLRLETVVQGLAEAQKQTQEELRSLTKTVEFLAWRVDRMTDEIGGLKDEALARRYYDRAPAYFGGPAFRKVRALSSHEVAQLLEDAIERGELTWEERQDILQADLVVRGRLPDQEEAHLVVEVSWGVGTTDVDRAIRRAARLGKVVKRAIPAVAGHVIIPEAEVLIRKFQVVQVTDGQQ